MKRSEVRDFIRAGVESQTPVIAFSFGKLNDFNAAPNKEFPHILLETNKSMDSITTLVNELIPIDTYFITLHICFIDKLESAPEVYENWIDKADLIAQKLIYQYNRLISGYKLSRITNIKRDGFIKTLTADCLSGTTLSFDLVAADQTVVCQTGDL